MPLVECVPNFSEGRQQAVIRAIREAVVSAPVHLLDMSSDADHNRTVMTFIGEPEAAAEAAFRAIQAAAVHIDLTAHRGVHPRIGAADVVPFVPLRDVSMAACAELARSLGRRVAEALALPVYLYDYAALRPERRSLADIRRGGYELLREVIDRDPERAPDFGPSRLGAAGAVAIGARDPLIAFNLYLKTDDVESARQIAAAVRTAGGGLPFLRALGLLVGGQAQVSLNILDFRHTPLYTIVEAVRREADKRGVAIDRAELIGLIPQAALIDYAIAALQLPGETRSQILERRVGDVTGDYRDIRFE